MLKLFYEELINEWVSAGNQASQFAEKKAKIVLILDNASFHKKEETKNENEKVVRSEYTQSSFKRSFTIDEKIATDAISAQYVNGVLTLNLPKKEIVKPSAQEISIQ